MFPYLLLLIFKALPMLSFFPCEYLRPLYFASIVLPVFKLSVLYWFWLSKLFVLSPILCKYSISGKKNVVYGIFPVLLSSCLPPHASPSAMPLQKPDASVFHFSCNIRTRYLCGGWEGCQIFTYFSVSFVPKCFERLQHLSVNTHAFNDTYNC